MAGTDLVDERGHTKDIAEVQEPTLDVDADPASETTPEAGEMVLANSTAEVAAMIENQAGADGDEHDLAELLADVS